MIRTSLVTFILAAVLFLHIGCAPPKSSPNKGVQSNGEETGPAKKPPMEEESHVVIPESDLPGMVYDATGKRVFGSGQSLNEEINRWKKALEQTPDNPVLHNQLGFAYYRVGEYGRATAEFEAALERKPNFPEAYCNLGLVHFNLGRYQIAINNFEKAVELKPDMADAYASLGHLYQLAERDDLARQRLEKAIEIAPEFALGYNNLGLLERKSGRLDKAGDCFFKAIEIKPDMAPAHFNLAHIFLEKRMTREAEAQLRRCLEIEPNHRMSKRLLLQMGVPLTPPEPEPAGTTVEK